MKFTLKQLLNIVDGRLFTTMDDVYLILNTCIGGSLMTHQLPGALDMVTSKKPDWYESVRYRMEEINNAVGNNFYKQVEYIDSNLADIKYDVVKIDFNNN